MSRIQKLEKEILRHKALYYQGQPEISDVEFDKLEDELKKIDPKNGALLAIGSGPTSVEKVKHEKKMLSLEKTYQLEELLSWKGDESVVSTFKLDGISCSLLFEVGHLVMAKTRGDGSFGENILNKILWIKEIPKLISEKNKIEIRGELFCDEEAFYNLSIEMEKIGLEKPTSQRNIVAGLVGRKDHLELCRHIKFMAFDYLSEENFFYESQKFKTLEALQFSVPEIKIHQDKTSIEQAIALAKEFMSEGDFQIDGLVFTYEKIALHEELGETSHHPRYKMAFKFQGESQKTQLKKIVWNVSRNGILTPVGEIVPVEFSGAIVSRVTLHNYGMVKANNLKEGDEIEIIRSGEVIPKFLSVIKGSRNQFQIPEACPACSEKIAIEGIRIYCPNKECVGKNKEMILNFIQKIGIENLSEKRLEELMDARLVKNIPDLYLLKESDLMKLNKIKEKLSSKLIESIYKTKKTDLTLFLSALGLSGGAHGRCEKIVRAGYNTIEKILALSENELIQVESFAKKAAKDFMDSLDEKRSVISELLMQGFVFTVEETRQTKITGKKICITGALFEKRSLVEEEIRKAGGIIVSSVSKNTDILLTNEKDPTTSKFKKAIELKITIYTEEEFKRLLK